jgi:hypothetical protein
MANDPDNASPGANIAVKIIAFDGYSSPCIAPKNQLSVFCLSPFSANAKSTRDPVSTVPMFLPVIAITEPAPIRSAPAAPMNSKDASANGVADVDTLGSVHRDDLRQSRDDRAVLNTGPRD